MPHPAGLDFLVNKGDWKQHRFDDAPVPELADGQVLFRVDRFAFTANNITYAVAGESLRYWDFFPAPEGWGRLPTMGYADVIESKHPDVTVGTRCFGFYPMSRYLVIEPSAVSQAGITDGAAHREGIAPFFAQYTPTAGDALYQADHEDALMLMRGLFMTSYLADDFIADRNFGEQVVLISSASSKTSIALAHCVSSRGQAGAIGITSPRNYEFVRKLGCYNQVVTYDEVRSLDATPSAVYVDMAGSSALQRDIHEHFGNHLKHSCSVGATHWEERATSSEPLPGPKPEFFFAPGQGQKRTAEWGPGEFQHRLANSWTGFRAFSEDWLEVKRGVGTQDVVRVYEETLAGRTEPHHGHVLTLWDES